MSSGCSLRAFFTFPGEPARGRFFEKCALAAVSELLEFEPRTFEPQNLSKNIKIRALFGDFSTGPRAGEGGGGVKRGVGDLGVPILTL